jgi:hypothetical protein
LIKYSETRLSFAFIFLMIEFEDGTNMDSATVDMHKDF